MNKKVICGALSTAVLFGACPMTALAEETLNTLDTNIMDFRNAEEDREGNGWYWDANGLTLTLENFYYEVPEGKLEEEAAIYLPDEAYVEIEGEDNVLNIHSYHCDAFYCEGEVNFYGDGELKITQDSSGADAIFVKKGPILIDDEVEITIESRGYLIYLDNASGDKNLISIQDDAKLIFNKEDHENRSIVLVKKSGVKTSPNWLDYAEAEDEWDDEYINLVARDTVTKPEKEETTQEPESSDETPSLNEYKIVVGNADILKNGDISYTADVVPYLNTDGYTMLPLRALLEVSNPDQKVNWNNGTKSAHTFVNNNLVSIRPGEATYTKVTEKIALHTPAETVNGRLFVSLRDWMSIMEIDVSQLDWDAKTKTVTLTY